MPRPFKAIVRKADDWWIGWVEELPGVNSQARTRDELLANLRSALEEALEMNRADALRQAGEPFEEATILV